MAILIFSAGALAAGGSVSGWGYDYYGQANGTPVTSGCECAGAPGTVPGISDATQVSGGYYHSVALRANGSVVAWGNGEHGQLGDGSEASSSTPVAVKGISNAISVAAGGVSSMALLSNGTVVAWGDNYYGELGQGNTTGPEASCACSTTPVPVPGLSNVVAIDAGYYYNLALLADGRVMTWGYDYYGELGDGTGVETGCECVDHPVAVPGISGAVGISADWYTASALLQDGTVRDWGYNYEGELGNGIHTITSSTECYCLGPVSPTGLAGAREIAAGGYHGLALLSNGTVSGWGSNEDGQVGNGEFSESLTPVAVKNLSGVKAISAGAYHSLALLSNGTVMGWGSNEYEQVGNGSSGNQSTPVAVSGLSGVSAIEANDYNSFAIVGPSQTLSVSLAGAGSGKVGGAGIFCPTNCTNSYPQGQVEVLRPEAASGSGFAGFSGSCTGVGPCEVDMGQDQTVTATFGPPAGTAISKSEVSSRKKSASFSFTAPGAITGFECELIRPKPKRKHGKGRKHHAKASRTSAKFSVCPAAKAYKHLALGRYTFKVRALDILGADAHPASQIFKIKPSKHHKHKHKRKQHRH